MSFRPCSNQSAVLTLNQDGDQVGGSEGEEYFSSKLSSMIDLSEANMTYYSDSKRLRGK